MGDQSQAIQVITVLSGGEDVGYKLGNLHYRLSDLTQA